MRLSIAKIAPVLAALTFALTASADVPKLDSKVTFHATGPAGLAIDGTGNKVTAEKKGDKILFRSSIRNMKTGMDLRDKHLNEHLKVPPEGEKTASLSIPEKVVDACKKPGCSGTAKGEFSMNGVNKPVEVTYMSKMETVKKKEVLAVHGEFGIIISDYIKKPCYLGVCVNDKVKVKVTLYPKE